MLLGEITLVLIGEQLTEKHVGRNEGLVQIQRLIRMIPGGFRLVDEPSVDSCKQVGTRTVRIVDEHLRNCCRGRLVLAALQLSEHSRQVPRIEHGDIDTRRRTDQLVGFLVSPGSRIGLEQLKRRQLIGWLDVSSLLEVRDGLLWITVHQERGALQRQQTDIGRILTDFDALQSLQGRAGTLLADSDLSE